MITLADIDEMIKDKEEHMERVIKNAQPLSRIYLKTLNQLYSLKNLRKEFKK